MENNFDAILVLGRGISPTGELPKSAYACVEKAAELFSDGVAPRIIMSGKWARSFDYVPPCTESHAMKDLAVTLGVPAGAILIEDESLDTISNFYNVKTKFLTPNGWNRVLLLVLPALGSRPVYLMQKILGPEFTCDTAEVDFMFPPEKHAEKVKSEHEKLIKLQEFLHDVSDGDHEAIFKMHMQYVAEHSNE